MVIQPSPKGSYEYFQQPMVEWNEESEEYETVDLGHVADENGITIYDNEYTSLLASISRFDDVAILSRYLANGTRILLGRGGSPDPKNDPFWNAATYSSTNALHTISFLLDDPRKAKYGNIHSKDCAGHTLILAAAKSFMHGLVKTGPMVEANDNHDSLEKSRVQTEEIMNLLLDRGACTKETQKKRNYVENSYSYSDDENGYYYVVFNTVLSIAITRASPSLVKRLIDEGADIHIEQNYIPDYGQIVPYVVATIEPLLAADPKMIISQDGEGDTPLHYAIRGHGYCGDKHVAIIEALCKHGAKSNIRGRTREIPLHDLMYCVQRSRPIHILLVDLLLDYGADVNDTDQDGNTALHFAAKVLTEIKVTQYLVSRGASVTIANHEGETPLHVAARGGCFPPDRVKAQDEMIEILLQGFSGDEATILMNQSNKDGQNPREICANSRKKWQADEEAERRRLDLENERRMRGLERGRGRGRGWENGKS
ncbi:hypothetical protein ACMFMG_008499 [Clarireedia jacksonii]